MANEYGIDQIKFGNPTAAQLFSEKKLVYEQANKLRNCQILDYRMFKQKDDISTLNFERSSEQDVSNEA